MVLLTDKDIDNLATPTTSFGKTDPPTLALMEPIKLLARKKLRQFIAWFFHIKARNNDAFNTLDDYLGLDHRMFDEYRTSGEYRPDRPMLADKMAPTPMPSTPPVYHKPPHNPVTDFQKTLKKDVNTYPDLKDDKGWDDWNRKTLVLARAQGFENVFDNQYTPKEPSKQALFLQHQRFMTAVFITKLHTVEGKAIVRRHWERSDAQSIYAELVDYYTNSVKAKLKSDDL